RRDRQERRTAGGGRLRRDAGRAGLPVLDALWRAFPVRASVLPRRADATAEAGARDAATLRPHDRARRRSLAYVGLQRNRSDAGWAFDGAGRPRRLGSGEK